VALPAVAGQALEPHPRPGGPRRREPFRPTGGSLDVAPEFGLSDLRTDVRCWSGIVKALGHTVISYSQDGNQSTVDVPLRQFEDRIVPFLGTRS
jgi:hypothetical protein